MIHRQLVLGLMLVLGMAASGQRIKAPYFGEGILNLSGENDSWSMDVGLRAQFLSTFAWPRDQAGNWGEMETDFLIRRARLKFDGHVLSPKFTYKIELGLSNRDMAGASVHTGNAPRLIYDAVFKYNFYENFVLWFGQTKLPGNVERVISSADLQLVDRSMLNARFNIDRDMGFQLRHHFVLGKQFLIREKLAMSQGEGRNVVVGNIGGLEYTGRLEFLPFGAFTNDNEYDGADLDREPQPKLMVGLTYDLNNNAVRTRANQGAYMENDAGYYQTDIQTLFWDAVFKYRGFSFMGEYAWRDADDPIAKNLDGTPTGNVVQVGQAINLQAGYLFENNWELAGRFTHVKMGEVVQEDLLNRQYTLGVSRYIVGHNLKVQSDVGYLHSDNAPSILSFRLQVEVQF